MVEISIDGAIHGDRWAKGKRDARAQVSLMEARVAALVADGADVTGVGDNLLVDFDLSEEAVPVGTRIQVGPVVLEVTDKAHLGCKTFSERFGEHAMAWVNDKSHRSRRLRGLHTRVIEGGTVQIGASVRRL
jgi:MOSC domain-containing protein YiiM